MLYVVASNGADGELRICIPISDVIHGQVDQGVKMLLDTGGEVAQRDLTFEMIRCPSVPLVVVFTKLDLIVPNVSSSRNDFEERCRSQFGKVPAEIVSSIYSFVCVRVRVVSHLCLQHSQSFASLSTN
jgi:hypothetical protein